MGHIENLEFIEQNDGDANKYKNGIRIGLRIGQAFFNALSEKHQDILRGTEYDPFHRGDFLSCNRAMAYLRGAKKGTERAKKIDDLIRKYSTEIEKIINDGTNAGRLTWVGLLVHYTLEYEEINDSQS